MTEQQSAGASAQTGIRERAAGWLFAAERARMSAERERMESERAAMVAEREKLKGAIEYLVDARRYTLTDESIARSLSETDSRVVDMILAQRGWTGVAGTGNDAGGLMGGTFSESARRAAVGDSRWMDHYDVQTRSARRIWTSFGFGQSIRVQPADPAAAQVWGEFVSARRNRPILSARKISGLSDQLITDGEIYFLGFVSTMTGKVTLRTLPTEKIVEILRDPDDPSVPLYYVRETKDGRVAYPDFAAQQPQLDRVVLPEGTRDVNDVALGEQRATHVVVIHVMINERNGRGWPEMWQAHAWARAYRDFLQDRATIAASRATYVEKLKTKGGARAIEGLQARLNSTLSNLESAYLGGDNNAPPAAGSTWIENESVTRERMDLTTGASDARFDGLGIVAQFATGAGIPTHYTGRTDAAQNKAIAREAGLPFYELIQNYQTLWIDVFTDILGVVLWAAEEYGGIVITSNDAQFHMDSPFESEISEITSALSGIVAAAEKGFIEPVPAQSMTLFLATRMVSAFGARDIDAIVAPRTVVDTAAIESEIIAGAFDADLEALEALGQIAHERRREISEDEPQDAQAALGEGLPDEAVEVMAGLQITPDEVRAALKGAPRAMRRALMAKPRPAGKPGRRSKAQR